jgi:hypothetical protein
MTGQIDPVGELVDCALQTQDFERHEAFHLSPFAISVDRCHGREHRRCKVRHGKSIGWRL